MHANVNLEKTNLQKKAKKQKKKEYRIIISDWIVFSNFQDRGDLRE